MENFFYHLSANLRHSKSKIMDYFSVLFSNTGKNTDFTTYSNSENSSVFSLEDSACISSIFKPASARWIISSIAKRSSY